jgi:hypothetical protein
LFVTVNMSNRDRSVGLATDYGLDGPVSIIGSAKFSLLHSIQTDFGAHPASYPIGTGDCFLGGKVAEA